MAAIDFRREAEGGRGVEGAGGGEHSVVGVTRGGRGGSETRGARSAQLEAISTRFDAIIV